MGLRGSSAAHTEDMPDKAIAEGDPPGERDRQGRWKANEPDAVFEIHVVDGEEGERIAAQHSRIFYEILEWYASQQPPPAAPDDTPNPHSED